MTQRIQLLNHLLANQIAAGEVVERPANVLKELLENSIDAGSTQIDVEIKQGGSAFIKVRDNGNGIDQHDLFLAVSRHATSKIATLEDLARIQTLGFRGEALASIASVSRFWLSSKPPKQELAFQIHINGRNVEPQLQPTAHPDGTTVIVEDLFFNTPARRKFMRSEKTEYLQIEEIFKRIVLSHFNIGFSLAHNQHIVYRLPPATTPAQQQRRVEKIFSKNFGDNACKIDMQATDLALHGWLGMPTLTRSQNDLQYIYLNNRIVRDKVINHALKQAFGDLLPEGRHPLYLLYLTIDPETVDVNVHPTKHEVRFQQARLIHDFIVQAVRKALQQTGVPLADLKQNESEITVWSPPNFPIYKVAETTPQYITSAGNDTEDDLAIQTQSVLHVRVENMWGKALALVKNCWVMSETPLGILLIDSQKAQEKLLVLRLQKLHAENQLKPRPLLFPHTENVTEKVVHKILQQTEILQGIGIEIDQLTETTLIVRQVPNLLSDLKCTGFLQDYCNLEHYTVDEILKLAAKHTPIINLSTPIQQQALLEDLSMCLPLDLTQIPDFCSHLSFTEISKRLS